MLASLRTHSLISKTGRIRQINATSTPWTSFDPVNSTPVIWATQDLRQPYLWDLATMSARVSIFYWLKKIPGVFVGRSSWPGNLQVAIVIVAIDHISSWLCHLRFKGTTTEAGIDCMPCWAKCIWSKWLVARLLWSNCVKLVALSLQQNCHTTMILARLFYLS